MGSGSSHLKSSFDPFHPDDILKVWYSLYAGIPLSSAPLRSMRGSQSRRRNSLRHSPLF